MKCQLHKTDWLLAVIMFVLTCALGYGTGQHEFPEIISLYTLLFTCYVIVLKRENAPLRFYLGLAIVLRLALVFSIPNLSNDVYRFIWDGRLLIAGFNPFDHLPVYYLENDMGIAGIDRALFESFGAKNFYSVYPPVAQAQFGSAVWLFPTSIYWSSVVMKSWLFAFETGTILLLMKLLKHFRMPGKNALVYALNPLIILEITGNLHFEGAMIFFLLLALYLLVRYDRRPGSLYLVFSAVAFSLSVASKLLTLVLLPFLVKYLGWKKSIMYFAITGITVVLLFLPVVNATFIDHFFTSLNLYFQKLEFNGSLYYLLRWIGFQIWGYNQIALLGPVLALLAFSGIAWMALFHRRPFSLENSILNIKERTSLDNLPVQWLFAICLYLFCTTTLHPWYLALPLVLCVFTGYRFPVVWSYLIFWTYIAYSHDPFRENLWVVGFEYLLVTCWLLYEWRINKEKTLTL